MGMRIFWTEKAQHQLEEIFTYYKLVASIKIAKIIVKKLVDRTIILENNPELGQKEDFLNYREEDFRYLVEDHYKIVYWIDNKLNFIFIAAVFDSRQNPKKLQKI